jgi:hypothetical protein
MKNTERHDLVREMAERWLRRAYTLPPAAPLTFAQQRKQAQAAKAATARRVLRDLGY